MFVVLRILQIVIYGKKRIDSTEQASGTIFCIIKLCDMIFNIFIFLTGLYFPNSVPDTLCSRRFTNFIRSKLEKDQLQTLSFQIDFLTQYVIRHYILCYKNIRHDIQHFYFLDGFIISRTIGILYSSRVADTLC